MIIYFYLFIPLLCRLAESSSIKGRNHKNDLVPFLSSRPDTQKDNSLKIVSNEPFIIQFQMPPHSKQTVYDGIKKDKKKKRPDKKRMLKVKPLRKKIRKRRDVSESESREDKLKKMPTEFQSRENRTQNFLSRQEMLKALNTHLKKKDMKKVKSEGMKNIRDVEKTDATSSRNLHRNHPPSFPDRDPHVKMIYPNTPKSDPHNYSYKDLISDRERLEQKINYIRNMLNVSDTTPEDAVRIRRKSDSDNTANKIAKMFLTLSAVNGMHDKKSSCRNDDDDRLLDIWEKENKKSPPKQSSSSNEERYKVKKWIEYMKSKRSSGKICPCMNEYNEENDIFPLEQKLAKGYRPSETGTNSEESSDKCRDTAGQSRGRPNKSGLNRNKEDARSKLRALANRGRRKYELPIDDLELYRSRAKQILQNAEEILDKIKEEEEKRLAAPHAVMSRLRELTSRIQGDPRNNENDLINIIQKNLGWAPQSKSQSSKDNNSFVENMKSFFLDPYEKAKALTDESAKKLSSYLLRNLGKIDSSEEQETAKKTDQSPQVFHGQVPQTEGMFSASLAKENPESDLLAKDREEHQNWSDTLSAILGGNDEDLGKKNTQAGESKQIKDQEDSVKRRIEEIIKEQEKKISGYTENPDENFKKEETTVIDLMAGGLNETPKGDKPSEDAAAERVAEMLESGEKDENVQKSEDDEVVQNGEIEKASETVKSTAEETGSDVTGSQHQQPSEDQTEDEEFSESIGKHVDPEGGADTVRADLPMEPHHGEPAVGEDSPKDDENVSKYSEDTMELKNAQRGKNQEGDVITETVSEFEEGTGEGKGKALESPEGQDQDGNVQSKEGREENDVLNSKHLIQEGDRSEVEELEEFKEDIQKLVEDQEGRPEETTKQTKSEENEGTILEKVQGFSETKDPEGNVAEVSDPVKLQKEAETTEESQNEPESENNALSGVVQASQDPKESPQYDDSEKGTALSEKENSAEGLVESEGSENPAQSFVESEKAEDLPEVVAEKEGTSLSSENERIDDVSLKQTESVGEETEREVDSPTSASAGEPKKDDETVREELSNQNDNEEKEILRESLNDAEEEEEANQEEPSLKASLGEPDNRQKSSEISSQKSVEEDEGNLDESGEEITLQSGNPESETLENNSGEASLKASKQSQEEKEEMGETEKDDATLKASKPESTEEIQDTSDEMDLKVEETEVDGGKNKEDPRLREELTKVEETDGENEELPLRSENPETESERSNESILNTSGSQEKAEAAEDETIKQENSESENNERNDETLKATAGDTDEGAEEIISAEMEKAEEQVEKTDSLEGNSRQDNANEQESVEIDKNPKLLMTIKEDLGEKKEAMTGNQEEGKEDNDPPVGDILSASEEEDSESGSMDEGGPVRAANPEADQEQFEEVQESQEKEDEDDVNVRAENIKNLDKPIDDEDGSEDLDEGTTLKEVNPVEGKDLDDDGGAEKADQMKELVSQGALTMGKKKNAPASEDQNQSKNTLKVPKSIGKIMSDLDGKEKGDYISLTNLNPEKIDHFIDKIDEAEHRNQQDSDDTDCRRECACADGMNTRSRNIGRYEIVKDFLHWVKDLHLNRVLVDD